MLSITFSPISPSYIKDEAQLQIWICILTQFPLTPLQMEMAMTRFFHLFKNNSRTIVHRFNPRSSSDRIFLAPAVVREDNPNDGRQIFFIIILRQISDKDRILQHHWYLLGISVSLGI